MCSNSDIICFDTEFTHIGEPLELSVCDFGGKEIYHSLFKPVRSRRWPLIKHRITPESVRNEPRFFKCAPAIQRIADNARYAIGYAIGGDIDILSTAGIERLDRLKIIEIREWYWLCVGKDTGVDFYAVPNLLVCANSLGVEFSEDEAHGATADTLATLRTFKALARIFAERYFPGSDPEDIPFERLTERFDSEFASARSEYLESRAACFMQLVRSDDGYRIRRTSTPDPLENAEAVISVKDRYSAELHFKKIFSRRRNPAYPHLYLLKKGDIERFATYTDAYVEKDSEMARSLLKLNKITNPIV